MLYTYDLQHNFGRSPTVKKFNPQLIFHISNTAQYRLRYGDGLCRQNCTNT